MANSWRLKYVGRPQVVGDSDMSTYHANDFDKLKPCLGPKIPDSYIILFKDGITKEEQERPFPEADFPDFCHVFLPGFHAPASDMFGLAGSEHPGPVVSGGSRVSSGIQYFLSVSGYQLTIS